MRRDGGCYECTEEDKRLYISLLNPLWIWNTRRSSKIVLLCKDCLGTKMVDGYPYIQLEKREEEGG